MHQPLRPPAPHAALFSGDRGFRHAATPRLAELQARYAGLVQRSRPGSGNAARHIFSTLAEIDGELARREAGR